MDLRDASSVTVKVRLDIPNPADHLKPGMHADIIVEVDAGEGLTIPCDSVLPTGSRMLVFIDKELANLNPALFKLAGSLQSWGTGSAFYQVTGGLQEEDRVASSANFLIDAERRFKGHYGILEKRRCRGDERIGVSACRRGGEWNLMTRSIAVTFKKRVMSTARHFRDLDVYQGAMSLVMRIFELTEQFPGRERYVLTDQVRRSSRSVCANLAEAWRKRRYEGAFVSKLSDAEAEAAETQVHIEIAYRLRQS